MRGDIGQTRLAQEAPPAQTADRRRRARTPSGHLGPRGRRRSPWPSAPGAGPTPTARRLRSFAARQAVRSAADRVRHASRQRSAMPRPRAGSAWPSLIASAHAATTRCRVPPAAANRPAAPSGRIFVQAGMFAVAENAHRLRARFAGFDQHRGGARQCQRQPPCTGSGWDRWRARPRRGVCSASSPRAGFRRPHRRELTDGGSPGRGPERSRSRGLSAEGFEVT